MERPPARRTPRVREQPLSGVRHACCAWNHGAVRVLAGKHCGEVSYYDDEADKATVYLGEPFESDYVLVCRDDLEKVTAKRIELERWKRKYPWLAKQLGLP